MVEWQGIDRARSKVWAFKTGTARLFRARNRKNGECRLDKTWGAADEGIPPKWLEETALEKWAEILDNCPWITPADADMLALYCDSYSHYLKAQRLSIRTPVVKTPEGKMIKNPAWTARNEAFQQMRSAGSELGLSPSVRSGIRVDERNPNDPAAKYFT